MGNIQSDISAKGQIRFTVNGKLNIVGPEVGVETRLVRFIREKLHLTGTKFSCGQGGCGACTVTVTVRDPGSGLPKTRAVNSVRKIDKSNHLISNFSSALFLYSPVMDGRLPLWSLLGIRRMDFTLSR